MIIHKDVSDVTVAAHTIKSLLDIKFTRAKERHANAMGFASSNHLLSALKERAINQDFDTYIGILKAEALSKHQLTLNDEIVERLRDELNE